MFTGDTIIALATAPVPAGVAVIRLSGPEAITAANLLAPKLKEAQPRTAHFTKLIFKETHLDDALALTFKAPNSFTGEDVVELHCHGSMAVTDAVIQACLTHPNVRMAQPGEFTRRAVENGKLDLTAAEGLADLIAAQTEAQRKQALNQLQGELGSLFENYRQKIINILAHVEAGIDFPDEELDIIADENVKNRISSILEKINAALATYAGERIRSGFKLAIIGKPNAGKSTLTNLLTGQNTAIVSPQAGTTRDVVQAQLDIGGFPVTLADTAGLRTQTEDTIEQEGIRRATQQAKHADLVIGVMDAADWPNIPTEIQPYLTPEKSLLIVSKIDQTPTKLPTKHQNITVLGLNLQDSKNIKSLLIALNSLIETQYNTQTQAAILTRQRHRDATHEAKTYLQNALTLIKNPRPNTSLTELLAQDLRNAAQAIGTVTGKTTSEDVLDLVFSTFCIGK